MVAKRDKVNKKDDASRELFAEVVRVQELHKTIRMAILGVVILGGLGIIGWVVVKVSESPPWLQALALLLGTSAPGAWLWRMRVRFQRYMANDHQRLVDLEASFDSERVSSGINPDGTSPDGT